MQAGSNALRHNRVAIEQVAILASHTMDLRRILSGEAAAVNSLLDLAELGVYRNSQLDRGAILGIVRAYVAEFKLADAADVA